MSSSLYITLMIYNINLHNSDKLNLQPGVNNVNILDKSH